MAYGLGVSPSEENVCVMPGQVKTITLYVSKSNDVLEGAIEVYVNDVSWVHAPEYLQLPEEGQKVPLNITIFTPKEIEYGKRTADLLICAPSKDDGDMPVQPCVQALVNIDVQETCPEYEAQKEYFKNLLSDILLALVFVLLLVYVFRRMKKKKKQVRRTKTRKKSKRRKK